MSETDRLKFEALTFDEDGVIKVIKERDGFPTVIKTWGDPDASKSVVAASLADKLLAVARKDGQIELRDPISGDVCFTKTNEHVVDLYLFNKHDSGSSSRLLSCTREGYTKIDSYAAKNTTNPMEALTAFSVDDNCEINCFKMHANEKCSLFGGKHANGAAGLYKYDLEVGSKTWTAEPELHLFGTGAVITSMAFLSDENENLFVAGSNLDDVLFYDTRENRKGPVKVIELYSTMHGEPTTDIQALIKGPDEEKVYIGTNSGDIFCLDLPTERAAYFRSVIGMDTFRFERGRYTNHRTFKYRPRIPVSGSVKFLVKHPKNPIIASGDHVGVSIWDALGCEHMSTRCLRY